MTDIPTGRAFDFPSNPQVGDRITLGDGTTFEWNGTRWSVVATEAEAIRFIHTESPASDNWVIAHNFHSRYVHVHVVDDAGNTVIPDVIYTDQNRTDLVFANPVEGTAILRR